MQINERFTANVGSPESMRASRRGNFRIRAHAAAEPGVGMPSADYRTNFTTPRKHAWLAASTSNLARVREHGRRYCRATPVRLAPRSIERRPCGGLQGGDAQNIVAPSARRRNGEIRSSSRREACKFDEETGVTFPSVITTHQRRCGTGHGSAFSHV